MTIEEARGSDKRFLTPAEIAPILGCDPQAIRIQAHDDPSKLGFPVVVVKSRTKIPRESFLKFIGG